MTTTDLEEELAENLRRVLALAPFAHHGTERLAELAETGEELAGTIIRARLAVGKVDRFRAVWASRQKGKWG